MRAKPERPVQFRSRVLQHNRMPRIDYGLSDPHLIARVESRYTPRKRALAATYGLSSTGRFADVNPCSRIERLTSPLAPKRVLKSHRANA